MRTIKKAICALVLRILFRALRILSHFDTRVQENLRAYPEGYAFRLRAGMTPDAPAVSFCKSGGSLKRLNSEVPADIAISFKSLNDAFLVLTGQLGIAASFAEHRFFLQGNPHETMELVRCMELAERYLFPRFLCRRLLPEIPEKQRPALFVYACLLFA
jgi:hypothetical protein